MIDCVGITGTQKGATEKQLVIFRLLIKHCRKYRGGVCIGADEQTAIISKEEFGLYCIGHLPSNPIKMSRRLDVYNELMPTEPYLERNWNIAYTSTAGIGLPKAFQEENRSGTWYTVRRFRWLRKPLAIIWPDGSILFEHGGLEAFSDDPNHT